MADSTASVHTPKYKISAGKAPQPLPASVTSRMVEIVVDQSVDMADMVKMLVRNDDFAISDAEDFQPGSKVEVSLGYEEQGANLTKCFSGEICAVQGDFPRRGSMNVRLIAYTEYHRLMRGKWMRSWEQKKYSDIASAIAAECKLKPAVDATDEVHEYVFQRNQTNHEFLLELAEQVGYEVFANDGKLFFRKPTPDGTKIRTLKKGEALLSFNPKTSVSLQPTGVKVLSYDDEKVAFVHGDAEAGDSGPKMQGKELGTDISVKVGPAGQVFTERVFRAVAPAKALALAELKRRALEFVHAEATVQGAADLRPGFVVEIAGVGEVFSGPYYITRVVHDYLPSGFTTRLGLKKTSIILEPPNQKDDSNTTQSRQTQDDDGEDSLDLGDGGAPAKPVLKNLQFAVGDKPPDWFLDDSGLDTGPQVTNLLLTYGPCPPEAHIIDPDVEGLPHETNLKFGYQVDPNAPPAPVFAGPMDAPLVAPPDPKPDIANVKLGYQEGQTYLGANLDDALKAQLAAADAPPKPDLADVKLGYQDGTGPQDLQNVDDLLKQQLAAASDATKPDLADVKLGYQDGVGVGVGSNGADNAWKPTDVDALAAPPQAPDLANVKLNYSEG